MATTIHLRPATRKKLAGLKSSSRESYDEILNRLLALIPEGDEEGLYAEAFRGGLLIARLDVGKGRLTNHDRVKRRLGL